MGEVDKTRRPRQQSEREVRGHGQGLGQLCIRDEEDQDVVAGWCLLQNHTSGRS